MYCSFLPTPVAFEFAFFQATVLFTVIKIDQSMTAKYLLQRLSQMSCVRLLDSEAVKHMQL